MLPNTDDDEVTVFHSDWVLKYADKSPQENFFSGLKEYILRAPFPGASKATATHDGKKSSEKKHGVEMPWDMTEGNVPEVVSNVLDPSEIEFAPATTARFEEFVPNQSPWKVTKK